MPGGDAAISVIALCTAGQPAVGKLPPRPHLWPPMLACPTEELTGVTYFRVQIPSMAPTCRGVQGFLALRPQAASQARLNHDGRLGLPRRFASHDDSARTGRGPWRRVMRLDGALVPTVVSGWLRRRLTTPCTCTASATPSRAIAIRTSRPDRTPCTCVAPAAAAGAIPVCASRPAKNPCTCAAPVCAPAPSPSAQAGRTAPTLRLCRVGGICKLRRTNLS